MYATMPGFYKHRVYTELNFTKLRWRRNQPHLMQRWGMVVRRSAGHNRLNHRSYAVVDLAGVYLLKRPV
jgi:hypothetical protein